MLLVGRQAGRQCAQRSQLEAAPCCGRCWHNAFPLMAQTLIPSDLVPGPTTLMYPEIAFVLQSAVAQKHSQATSIVPITSWGKAVGCSECPGVRQGQEHSAHTLQLSRGLGTSGQVLHSHCQWWLLLCTGCSSGWAEGYPCPAGLCCCSPWLLHPFALPLLPCAGLCSSGSAHKPHSSSAPSL